MYYSEDNEIKPFSINYNDITIVVSPEKSSKRFALNQNSSTFYFNNINTLTSHFDDVNIRKEIKGLVYKRTKEAFFNMERELPDSTQGVLQFLLGNDYRTNQFEGVYSFRFNIELVAPLRQIAKTNTAFELCEHIKSSTVDSWPLRKIVKIKTKTRSYSEEWVLDPYQIIDLFISNIEGKTLKQEYLSINNTAEEIIFKSMPNHNRVIINVKGEKMTQSYMNLQTHLLEVIKQILDIFVEKEEYIAVTYILNYWDLIYKSWGKCVEGKYPFAGFKNEQDRILRKINGGLLEKGAIPWNLDDLLSAGVQDYYYENIIPFNESSKMMQSYAKKYAILNNITIEDLLANIRSNYFYCYGDDFIR